MAIAVESVFGADEILLAPAAEKEDHVADARAAQPLHGRSASLVPSGAARPVRARSIQPRASEGGMLAHGGWQGDPGSGSGSAVIRDAGQARSDASSQYADRRDCARSVAPRHRVDLHPPPRDTKKPCTASRNCPENL